MASIIVLGGRPKVSSGVITAENMREIQQYYLLANARFIKAIQYHKLSRRAREVWPAGYSILAASYKKKQQMLAAGREYYAALYIAYYDASAGGPTHLSVLPRDLRRLISDNLTVVTNTDSKCIVQHIGMPYEIPGLPYQIKTYMGIRSGRWMNGMQIVLRYKHIGVARPHNGKIICSCNRKSNVMVMLTLQIACTCPCGRRKKCKDPNELNTSQCCGSCDKDTIDYEDYKTMLRRATTELEAISYDIQHVISPTLRDRGQIFKIE